MMFLEFEWSFRTISCTICLVIALCCAIALKIVQKIRNNDEEYLERQREKEEEYYRTLNKEREMQDYVSQISYGYEDDYTDE